MKNLLIATLCLLISSSICFGADSESRRFHREGLNPQPDYQSPSTAMASRDTVVLIGPWGSGALANGQFETPNGAPAWNGWTHWDSTQPTSSHWQLSDYHADNLPGGAGNQAAWCGDIGIVACSQDDAEGGYGNSWNDIIEWRAAVANPTIGVDVHFTAYANIDSEPNYDGTTIYYMGADDLVSVAYFDGLQTGILIDEAFALSPADYQGEGSDEVVIQIKFTSDGGWSDEDCSWPTAGAIQVDDITVTLNQGSGDVVSYTNFEDGWGDWAVSLEVGVGDFTGLWMNLEDVDPCVSNYTPQVAFIDDGNVVPGAGPSLCIDWCYGPGGYIVNTTGGLAGPDAHLYNLVESPIIPWPGEGLSGATVAFSVYQHEDLSVDAPGMFWSWSIRSTSSEDPADIEMEPWKDRSFYYYGGPGYFRRIQQVGDLLEQGRQFVQVQFACHELGYYWGWEGDDGYPAPYFDNVRLTAYDHYGPSFSGREIDMAQDNFPTIGEVDLENLGNNSVRFDMANNSSFASHLVNIPGDSIVFDIAPQRTGAEFVSDPEMVVAIKANPLFDPYRVLPAGLIQAGDLIEGSVPGVPAVGASGIPSPDKWAFDLPDENFLFPGDVVHYYLRATDDDGVEEQTATLPASGPGLVPEGFGDFSRALAYNSSYTFRALPSVFEDVLNPGNFVTPPTLFWNDFANRGGESEWHGAFANLALEPGFTYDTYYTNGPSSGVGNGLGGRATALSLIGYDHMVYTSGDLGVNTISNGDFQHDPSDDLGVLDSWLRQGEKDLFMTGDEIVYDLTQNAGAAAAQFVADWMKVSYVDNNLRHLINNQSAPLVKAITGNGIFGDTDSWIAYGGCFGINTFDAVTADVANGAMQLAEFTDPSGAIGAYTYSAATLYEDAITGSRVISLPYDLMYIFTDPGNTGKASAPLPARAVVLEMVLGYFGFDFWLPPSPVPEVEQFAVHNYPNPFNPITRIEYTMPKAGHLKLKVFNVRGELVKTLVDDHIEASGHVMWDGTNDAGAKVSSGLYFYEARTAGQVMVEKMTLVK